MSLKAKILKELETRPHRLRELKEKFGNDKKVARLVDELEKKNKITCREGLYAPGASGDAVECILVKLGKTFGFARACAGSEEFFIRGRALRGAMPGDRLLVLPEKAPREQGNREGRVLAVLEEQNRFAGTVHMVEGRLALIPDACPHTPLVIKKSADGGAQEGEKAAVEILERGGSHSEHRAGVAMRFGDAQTAKHCARAILYTAGIDRHFPARVKAEAKRFAECRVTERDCQGREDFRALPVFTIDSADTKDIDDAISAQRTEYGYRLCVHIADVSHYVRPGTELDREAFRRGTSVYYADAVIPMLPKALSNGICSLDAGKDRLAFSCVMELDCAGRVTDAVLKKSVIRSRVKGVYTEINEILAGRATLELEEKYGQVWQEIPLLWEIYEKLQALHRARGAMEIEADEARLILDESERCVAVEKRVRGEAERMIEEFMLLANESVAAMARRARLPFVYRVHAAPEAARVDSLTELLHACGAEFGFKGEVPTTLELSRLLEETWGTAVERAVHTGVLRSMAKARYAPVPSGHFGLALADYAHFTSPIRRYPDLAIHRILTDWLAGAAGPELDKRYGGFAAQAAEQSSEREQAAMNAERSITDCYKAEAMRAHLGDEFEGVVSGVTSFGLYVELPNTVEGLIRAERLSDHPLTLTGGMCLSDALSGRSWKLGDRLRVRLTAADVAAGHVDFEPC